MVYSLTQKRVYIKPDSFTLLPEDVVKVIASYDPTKEIRRKELKKSFAGIRPVSHYDFRFGVKGSADTFWKLDITIWEILAQVVTLCSYGVHPSDIRYQLGIRSSVNEDEFYWHDALETDLFQYLFS